VDSMLHAMVACHALRQIANWAFVDWMLNFREETIQSTSRFVRQALRIASTRTRALGGSSPDFANCASSPNGTACIEGARSLEFGHAGERQMTKKLEGKTAVITAGQKGLD